MLSPSPLQREGERVHIFFASLLFFWLEMEQGQEKLSDFDRFHILQHLKKNNIDLNKKRKLQADELGLPKPKHKCCDQSCSSDKVSGLETEGKTDLEIKSDPDKNLNFSSDRINETEEDVVEQSITDKELEELLYMHGLAWNGHAISAATWIVHEEAESGPRKATIDEEFEQYFSMLNL